MDEEGWILDSLVNFLGAPVWNLPILNFIEEKSIIFDSESDFEGKAEEYKKLHDKYKNLVDFMLGSYMEDIGITPEQFEAACGKASKNIKTDFHQRLLEQVWAADDYEIFKGMMIQKNLELQLQALEILQCRYGVVPKSFIADGDTPKDEDQILQEVLKKSLEDHEANQRELDEETQALERCLAESSAEKERLENQKWQENLKMQRAMKLSEPTGTPPSAPTSSKSSDVSEEEVQKRKEYLNQQRDRLLSLKKEQRLKQLKQFESSSSRGRPKSSYAAKRALAGKNIDPQTLQVRKALAAALKDEVIND